MSAPTVFLSAATIDLEPWRDTLHAAFEEAQLRPVCQNYNLGAPLHDVRDMLVRRIEQADCIIHLAGMGYGGDAFQPFADDPDFRCSWTQFEYYYAHSLGKSVIGVVMAPDLSTPDFAETGTDAAEKTLLQEAHRKRVATGKFDGTPLAAKSRTLNREANSIHELIRVIAAAIGELHLLGAEGEKAVSVLSLRLSRFQLPPVKANFTGRETDLVALRDLGTGDSGSAAVITGLGGMGGIGKSELAKVLAHEWRPRFPDAQIWLDGYGTRTDPPPPAPGDLISQVIRAFHPQTGPLPEDLATLKALYRQTLEGKKVLVVLDNAAHPEVVDQAGPLVPPEGCGLIVTSRRNFLVGGKAPYTVGRLPEPEAVALLREICPAINEPDAARVAALCGGLPLALRLAGAHFALDGASPAAVATYLTALAGGRLAALDADAADAGEGTIEETLRLSVDPLPAHERAAWLRLGVFTGDFDADAARAVAEETCDPDFLTRLARRNLLERDTTSGNGDRYRLHDLAANYALDRLAMEEGEGVLDAAHLAHAGHYTAVAVDSQRIYLAGNPLDGLARFDRERVQIEAAFAWLVARPDVGSTDRVLLSLVDGVVHTGQALRFHPLQRIAWLEVQIGAARRLGDREAEGNALGNLGITHADLGETRHAIEYFERQLEIASEIGNRRGEGNAFGNLGNAHLQLGAPYCAIGYYEEQLVVVREIGDRHGEANAQCSLGSAHLQLGDARRAIGYFDKALEIDRVIRNRHGEGTDLGLLGVAHRQLGETRLAIGYYEQQLEIAREIGDRRGEGRALGNLGNANLQLGDARRAIGYFERQLEIVREIDDRSGEGIGLWNAALAHKHLGEKAGALARAEASLAILEVIEDPNAAIVRAAIAEWPRE